MSAVCPQISQIPNLTAACSPDRPSDLPASQNNFQVSQIRLVRFSIPILKRQVRRVVAGNGRGGRADFLGVVDGEAEEVGEGVEAVVAVGVELAEEV
jgi:hypothetical protein